MFTNQTQDKLERDLKSDRLANKEINRDTVRISTYDFMKNAEAVRKKKRRKHPRYTQKYVSKKASIGLSTYKKYLSGKGSSISIETAQGIASVLGCKMEELLTLYNKADEED